MILEYVVKNNNYESLNQLIKLEYGISTRLLTKLIKNKKILINKRSCDTRIKPQKEDVLEIMLDLEEDNSNITSTKMDINIVYEDAGLLIVDKPAGIAIHPSIRHYNNTLANGIKYYYDKIGLKKKIRPVNRLDLDTSGIVVFAKNEYIQESLIKQMKLGTFKKEYICAISGNIKPNIGTIDLPIARKYNSVIERCVRQDGQKAITNYEVLEENDNYSVIKCELETGRTHQIRVHMSYLKHPLLGDTLYGSTSNLINRQALHCYRISFEHPITKRNLNLICKLPNDLKNLCNKIII